MKTIDTNTKILNIAGEPIVIGEEDLTFKDIAIESLQAPKKESKKAHIAKIALAMRIHQNDTVKLNAKEIVTIDKSVHNRYDGEGLGSLIITRIDEILGAEESEESDETEKSDESEE